MATKKTTNKTTDNENKAASEDSATNKVATAVDNPQQNADGNAENRQIKLESTKDTLAKRPWRLGAVEINAQDENGNPKKVWVAAVIDAEGHALCCGDAVDMEFIIKLENSYDSILNLMNTSGKAISDAVDVLQDFECKKTKAFKFN